MKRRPTKAKAIDRLQKARHAIPALKQLSYDSEEFSRWHRATRLAIGNTFHNEGSHLDEFTAIQFFESTSIVVIDYTHSQHQAAYNRGLASADSLLRSMIDEVNEYWGDDDQNPSPNVQEFGATITNEVFIVHGRDDGTKNTVARFLERLDLQPIVLADQPNRGFTTIEKFEHHAQVSCAVVLLTPDDVGSLKGTENILSPRARQNVIFELGFFFGSLGRGRVCALTKGDVEIPSDYAGVVYIPFDDHGGWQLALSRELQAAGFTIDANRVL